MFATILLFTGFCTLILVLAISNVYGKRVEETPGDNGATEPQSTDQQTRA
ncbi:MAG: hypothetical protein HY011_19720 [Acidobacteria bacterium]|nr:hypothetical protein [Acidobacteriota bacterium]